MSARVNHTFGRRPAQTQAARISGRLPKWGGQASQRERHHREFLLVALALIMTSALAAAPASASLISPSDDIATSDELTREQMSVRELMRLDTALALSLAHSKLKAQPPKRAQSYPDSRAVLPAATTPRLQAIYGVGKKLMAEVMIGSRPYVYMHGMPLPVGGRNEQSVYRSRGIDGRCIALERDEERLSLCLEPSVVGG